MNLSRNKLIGSISVAALVAGTLVAAPTVASAAVEKTVQVLGINDFHGRIGANGVEAGAAVLAGAVDQLRAAHPDTVFAAAGDLIGASTFESFIANDKPTIDALNEAGLEVSAVGNHEFDLGYDDLVNRVMAPYDPVTNEYGGAGWQYLGANVRLIGGTPALPESWIRDFGDVQVGFIGAVTDHLAELVSPAGISGLTIEAPVVAANREADVLKAEGADIVVLLVHEGAATTALSSATDPTSDFGEIVNGVDGDIDAIVSGHTHLAYNHSIPVQQWIDEGRAVTTRPVVSAGQYGYNLNQLLFDVSVDEGTGAVSLTGVQQKLLPLVTTIPPVPPSTTATFVANYPADPATKAIVDQAVADAAVLGAVQLGAINGPFNRAKLANGTTENRGGESTLGNLVAEVQQWATEDTTFGGARIAFMNPGGLRADLLGNPSTAPGSYPADVTYRQAANVQPFANTLVNMQLTGTQIKAALEQQWQPAGAQRPRLHLGVSEGFTYTYDPNAANGSRITGMWLDGKPIEPATGYSVTVNSFLAAGGDNFSAFAAGTQRRDSGKIDLQTMVDYLANKSPVGVDYTQRSVGVSFPSGAPAAYAPGDTVAFTLSSLAFSAAADQKDPTVTVQVDGRQVGAFPVDNTIGTTPFDENGTAQVSFVLPALKPGAQRVTITGATTGTTTTVPITVAPVTAVELTASTGSQIYGDRDTIVLNAAVSSTSGQPVTGDVDFVNGSAVLATAPIVAGRATYRLPATTPAGQLSVVAKFKGSSSTPAADSAPVAISVVKATSAAALLATRTDYRQNPIIPSFLIGAVVLNNGQTARGSVQITRDGSVVGTAPLTRGLFAWSVPRSLAKGAYTFQATYVPSDPANIAGVDSNRVSIQIR